MQHLSKAASFPGTGPHPSLDRLAALRAELAGRDIDGFIVPRADEHQGEYVAPSAQRLSWLTGFTGSAGLAIVLAGQAALFVDGRYTLQAEAETDPACFTLHHLVEEPPPTWLAAALKPGMRLGFDPWLHTPNGVELFRQACARAGAELVPLADNPLDAVWTDRPAPPLGAVSVHPLCFAGLRSEKKRADLALLLAADRQDCALLTAPDSIAWLLNIRGSDIPFSPLPFCFALLHADAHVDLFIDPRKLGPDLPRHLGRSVRLAAPQDFGPALDRLGGRRVRLDPASAPSWAAERLKAAGAHVEKGSDPCALPKACKNAQELKGTRHAHRRDGAALCRFLAWLAETAPAGGVSELIAAERLEGFREKEALYKGPSFPTISGAGPNGAIVHYRSTPATNRRLEPGQIYLVDSGGQYLDGTTDVTRTVAIGEAGAEERHRFTLVLQGHIALAASRFPAGTTGSQLDALARHALWQEGLDYDHGTGHGVGSYLGVHEGPQRISKMPNDQPLLPGMILSDEPGYYRNGAYGIRIENLVAVHASAHGGERPLLEFEVLTLAPIDLNLVDRTILSRQERAWLNGYHRRVRRLITPLVDERTADWLAQATRAV